MDISHRDDLNIAAKYCRLEKKDISFAAARNIFQIFLLRNEPLDLILRSPVLPCRTSFPLLSHISHAQQYKAYPIVLSKDSGRIFGPY